MVRRMRHLALVVPELRSAEAFYRDLFGMDLIGREAQHEGRWASLPPDTGWAEAEAAGVELGMVALRRGGFVLALFRGEAEPGQVFAVGLEMPAEELHGVRERLPKEVAVVEDSPLQLAFRDPYGITWQLSTGGEFRTTGDVTGEWLDV